ncbi:MAG: alpha/beta hydrolase [Kiloniellales bacterium]|nr:alpha/beta hydrolase [Kiloniellales bacterium]
MSDIRFLFDGPAEAPMTLVLAHGAGAPMDSPFMTAFAEGLGERGLRIARFEFPYMAARRADGRKRPPDGQAKLLDAWRQAVGALQTARLSIGGKSMGGRMASLVADEVGAAGLVCLGYPFHPPDRPERLRTAHLKTIRTPSVIAQGTRDPFGTRAEVEGYELSEALRFHWAEDGNHDLAPRKASGRSVADNWSEAMDAVAGFLLEL